MDDLSDEFDSDTGDPWYQWGTKPRKREIKRRKRKVYNDKYDNVIIILSLFGSWGILWGITSFFY